MAGLRTGAQGRWARLGIGAQVVLTGVLALAAVMMLNWLAGRPSLRHRFDLTATEQNTLSTATMGVLERLPGELTIDVFFRGEPGPLEQVAFQAQERTRRMLGLYRELSYEQVRVRYNDMTDNTVIEERRRELKLRGIENCLVVHYQGAREVVSLIGGLASFDIGQPRRDLPNPRPPSILEFKAEKAVTEALLKVTRGEVLEVYFLTGHGELEIPDTEQSGLDELAGLLTDEGLRVSRWNPTTDGPLPEDCACLSILRPQEPLPDETIDSIEAYVRGGGRLVVAPPSEDAALERSNLNELLERFDLEVLEGVVCQPAIDPNTGTENYGDGKVALFPINPANMSKHSLVEPFRVGERSFLMHLSHPVRFTKQPELGLSAPLFKSELRAWVDDAPWDFRPDEALEAYGRSFELAIATQFRLDDMDPAAALEQEPEARIVLVGGAFAFTNSIFQYNQDFLRNLYNWVLAREYRISMSPKPTDIRLWPEDKLDGLPRFNQFAWGWIPGLCLALGALFAFLRARGGPRSAPSTKP